MAILFKDNGGDLLTDVNFQNPYTNAIKNADGVIGIVDKIQARFAAQTEKNRLMEKEALTGAAMADVMAGRALEMEGIDPSAIDMSQIATFGQKKAMDDATIAHQSVMQIEAARAAKANEALKVTAQEDRQTIQLGINATKAAEEKRRGEELLLKQNAAAALKLKENVITAATKSSKGVNTQEELDAEKATLIAKGDLASIAAADEVANVVNARKQKKYAPEKQIIDDLIGRIEAGGDDGELARKEAAEKYPHLGMTLKEKQRYFDADGNVRQDKKLQKELADKYGDNYIDNATYTDEQYKNMYKTVRENRNFGDNIGNNPNNWFQEWWNNNTPNYLRDTRKSHILDQLNQDIESAPNSTARKKAEKAKRTYLKNSKIRDITESLKLRSDQLKPKTLF